MKPVSYKTQLVPVSGEAATRLDVVTFGEAMALLVAETCGDLADVERFTRRLAGCETNVAVGLARLGLQVGWVSRLGLDPFGDFVRATLAAEGVDCSHVATDPVRSTGRMFKAKTPDGSDPTIHYARKGSAASQLSPADFDPAYFRGARLLHATGVAAALSSGSMALALHAICEMRAWGRTVCFDPNLRPSLWPSRDVMIEQINSLAGRAHWVLPGLSEGVILTGYRQPRDIAAFYLDCGVELVVVKLGAEGAYFRTPTQEGIVPAARVEQVVDTVGAGDGFAAGLISALLEGESIEEAVARGNRVGACAIQVIGDMDGLPTRAQLGQTALLRVPA
ncbi:2-dehydro-3-deoxygluconokinase [Rhodovastum atsumiense]|uniref:Sugar kinase n=1 Tax=Rhodovastum atsumiense TaxID=504468 RepID=A0A5M6IK41_9PROT|nr:sugar kinase [Rhodovastum atsumiense]KAA5608229.1 sugar kinase [Rhodovastum atsumiense]CAH2599378.1 2-dehydro-3-deoxygluconokinase [Rhodovastum atsumiense]